MVELVQHLKTCALCLEKSLSSVDVSVPLNEQNIYLKEQCGDFATSSEVHGTLHPFHWMH